MNAPLCKRLATVALVVLTANTTIWTGQGRAIEIHPARSATEPALTASIPAIVIDVDNEPYDGAGWFVVHQSTMGRSTGWGPYPTQVVDGRATFSFGTGRFAPDPDAWAQVEFFPATNDGQRSSEHGIWLDPRDGCFATSQLAFTAIADGNERATEQTLRLAYPPLAGSVEVLNPEASARVRILAGDYFGSSDWFSSGSIELELPTNTPVPIYRWSVTQPITIEASTLDGSQTTPIEVHGFGRAMVLAPSPIADVTVTYDATAIPGADLFCLFPASTYAPLASHSEIGSLILDLWVRNADDSIAGWRTERDVEGSISFPALRPGEYVLELWSLQTIARGEGNEKPLNVAPIVIDSSPVQTISL
ncbi:hypothetical protein [Engelhardtia mirabilis]|uniref:Uncharacterized protein n=1 Tax=Engelhardtia mirabilis TaxID=2528011 RepID=A0A518BEP4_9BACT|nr:hypothetical protein Pla133_05300 [Planctomycetes bacterium Pla133]QDU99791.1 hypothetical protein Pla86_05300 [Planctomycetes bacterium Pla86]